MSKRISEKRLVDVLMSYFRNQDYAARREFRHYERRIDVVLLSGADELWAIEAKTTAWGRALHQAIINLAAAERSYIAIHSRHVHRVPHLLLDENCIGLISVGTRWGDVTILKEAAPSPYVNRLAIERIKKQICNGKDS